MCDGHVNIMTLRTLMLIAAVMTYQLHAKVAPVARLNSDTDDGTGKYQYFAAHCLSAVTHIQYGNMTIPFKETESQRKVVHIERPPASNILEPDLGVIYVNSVFMNEYGRLSAVDYKVMAGHSIEYANFGFPKANKGEQQDQVHPLQLREGVVSLCNEDEKSAFAPYLCVAPKCSDREQQTPPGEPGSPLYHAGKLAGVHVGATLSALRSYTPVSPYLSWIQRVMNKGELISRTNIVNTYIPTGYEYLRFQDLSKYLQGLKARLARYKDEVLSPLLQEFNIKNVTPRILAGVSH